MTAEIGILNRQGVALAADSAVTIGIQGKQKVLNSANKLFNLVKGLPVGLMVYGRGDFLGIPWEIIVNEYRKNFDSNSKMKKLEDYSESFINELNNIKFKSNSSYRGYVDNLLATSLAEISEETKRVLMKKYPNIEVKPTMVLKEFSEILIIRINKISNLDFAKGFTDDDIEKILNDSINIEICNENFERLFNFKDCEQDEIIEIDKLAYSIIEDIKQLNALTQTKDIFFDYSGIVITGFGEDELFPVLYEYYIEGIINDKLKYKLNKVTEINSEHIEGKSSSEIIPFAQQEMVHAVLTGIDPSLENLIFENLQEIIKTTLVTVNNEFKCENCEKKALHLVNVNNQIQVEFNNLISFINNIRRDYFVNPILEMVDLLPKDELATMAETLVNITSFKRKITMDTETVGGPIDVAVISKSEGFIWIKRKYYFKPELNRDYFLNKGADYGKDCL